MTGLGASLEVRGVSKSFGTTEAVRGIDLESNAGSFTALLGPSGCGKSTLLALIAGLERPDSGTLTLDGADLLGVKAERRPIGLVFQKPLLFPNLTVADNVAFGLRMTRTPRRIARVRAEELLEKVDLAGLGARRVGQLSGGQEQRVALARALALRPRLLLLDEPFSQLDPQLRSRMRDLVRELASEEKTTTLFVTHDLDEAVEVADDIVLMLEGSIEGSGRPVDFYLRPPSLAAARFFNATNEIDGIVRDGVFLSGALTLPFVPLATPTDGPAVLVVRPESLTLTERHGPMPLDLNAYPLGVRFAGSHRVVHARTDSGTELQINVPTGTTVIEDQPLRVVATREACTVFSATTGQGR